MGWKKGEDAAENGALEENWTSSRKPVRSEVSMRVIFAVISAWAKRKKFAKSRDLLYGFARDQSD